MEDEGDRSSEPRSRKPKLAFNGTGEAAIEAEVSEARLAADTVNVGKEVIKDAIKQAVNQAVLKLSMPKSAPVNESRKKKEGVGFPGRGAFASVRGDPR